MNVACDGFRVRCLPDPARLPSATSRCARAHHVAHDLLFDELGKRRTGVRLDLSREGVEVLLKCGADHDRIGDACFFGQQGSRRNRIIDAG